jgi:hypothetical protein
MGSISGSVRHALGLSNLRDRYIGIYQLRLEVKRSIYGQRVMIVRPVLAPYTFQFSAHMGCHRCKSALVISGVKVVIEKQEL